MPPRRFSFLIHSRFRSALLASGARRTAGLPCNPKDRVPGGFTLWRKLRLLSVSFCLEQLTYPASYCLCLYKTQAQIAGTRHLDGYLSQVALMVKYF